MRLICPNCSAEYEVDAALIPVSGRDVQCSNCGSTWFQGPAQAVEPDEPESDDAAKRFFSGKPTDDAPEPGAAPEAATADDAEPEPADDAAPGSGPAADAPSDPAPDADAEPQTDESHPPDAPEPAPERVEAAPVQPESAAGFEAGDSDTDDGLASDTDDGPASDAGDAPAPDAGDVPARRPIDPKVLGILRAEAEREIAQRRAEAQQAVETQDDLGLEDPARRPRPMGEAAIRTARLRGLDDPAADAARQKDVLPNIASINASLTSTGDRAGADPAGTAERAEAKRRTGFRFGFTVTILAFTVLILTYLYAPEIAAAVPGLEAPLAEYVDWANGVRLGLDGLLARAALLLSGEG